MAAANIPAPCQPYFEARIFIGVNYRFRRKIPHRISASAELAPVRCRPVDDPGIVQGAFSRFQLEINGLRLVHVFDLGGERILGPVNSFIVRKSVAVGAWQHPHAAVLLRASVYGQPYGYDFVERAQSAFPVCGVFVPWSRPADIGVFADEVAGPQSDVGADDRLDKIEDFIAEQEVEQPLVAEMRRVQLVGQLASFHGELLLENIRQRTHFFGAEQRLFMKQIPALPV
uniref:Predicted protein n=1 Tax=Physcomitrium patens TaxID=3218 RepID=A9U6B7_PHYPA